MASVCSISKDAHHKFPQRCSRWQQGGHGICCHCFKFQLLQYLVLTQLDSSLFTGRIYKAVNVLTELTIRKKLESFQVAAEQVTISIFVSS